MIKTTNITNKNSQSVIAFGEGYKIELKRSANSDLPKEMVAFANAGLLFLSSLPAKHIPQSKVICAIVKGVERVNILDKQEFSSDIISNIEAVLLYLKQHLKTRYVIKDIKREEHLELPEIALLKRALQSERVGGRKEGY